MTADMSEIAHWASSRTSTSSISSFDIDAKSPYELDDEELLGGSEKQYYERDDAACSTWLTWAARWTSRAWDRVRPGGNHHSPAIPVRARKRLSPLVRTVWDRPLYTLYMTGLPVVLVVLLVAVHRQRTLAVQLDIQLSQEVEAGLASYGRQGLVLSDMRAAFGSKRRRGLLAERQEKEKSGWIPWARSLSSSTSFPAPTSANSTSEDSSTASQKPLEEQLEVEMAEWWPSWWGSSSTAGPSPFDFVPAGTRPRRVLFLTDYEDYLSRMNTHTYEIVDAALRYPQLKVDVWGPGWKGYDSSLPLSENVRRWAWRVQQLEEGKVAWEAQKEANESDRRLREDEEAKKWKNRIRSHPAVQLLLKAVAPEKVVPPSFTQEKEPKWTPPEEWATPSRECASVQWDIVWTISDIFKQDDPLVDALTCGALLVQQIGDCHEKRCLNEWYPYANNITLSKYAFELPELFGHETLKARFPGFTMGLFGHSPDTGNEWDFWPLPWKEKKVDATMFGFDGSFYPIRTTITDHLNRSADEGEEATEEIPLIGRHEHPGYVVSYADDPEAEEERRIPLETYQPGHPSYARHIFLREDFARAMRETRICVFDSSLERKTIRKYAQALLSGCVIAADLPTEHTSALRRFVIPLKPDWPVEQIEATIREYLSDPARLEQMALDGFAWARSTLTTTRKVADVLDMADRYRNGDRGYIFPHAFSMECRSYWSGDGWKQPWC